LLFTHAETSVKYNAPLRGKNTFAKMVEGRKQQTYFCPA
jgi:hypothetical protein